MTVVERSPITATERANMVALYTSGNLSILRVASETGRSTSAVWNVLEEEGVPRRKPGRRVGQGPVTRGPRNRPGVGTAERADIVRLYQAGFSMSDVAKKTRRGIGTISQVLEEEGVPRRRPGPRTRHFCGRVSRHTPHIGCNGFGYDAGPPEGLCPRDDIHDPHLSCDGRGAGK